MDINTDQFYGSSATESGSADPWTSSLSDWQFPLTLKFEKLSLGQRVSVHDSNNSIKMSVLQKPFKLKDEIQIWLGNPEENDLGQISADKIIDYNGSYQVYAPLEVYRGSINRFGTKSIWKATYCLRSKDNTQEEFVREVNPWVKVADAILMEIPVVGYLHGYVFHPKYSLPVAGSQVSYELEKLPCFFEGRYLIHKHSSEVDENLVFHILSLILVALFERKRG
jgi:hypothetical protein